MKINRKHIDRVFSQKFSLFDLKMLEKYFEDKKLNEEAKFIVKEQWEQFVPGSGELPELDDVFYKFYYTIDNSPKQAPHRSDFLLRISKIAAILIVGVLIAAAVYFSDRGIDKTTNLQMVEIVSHEGFRSQFTLPDGTTGWLGYGSGLKYHVDQENRRIVDLDGLAFFDVNHQKGKPFIVKTPAKLDIEVLGTKFNISAYSADRSCDVVLQAGSLKLNMGDRAIQTMKPNERVVYRQADNSIKTATIKNIDDFLAWKDGRLVLRNISLKEACMKLSRFYNVDFELQAKGLDDMEIQLTLENETLENALNLLAKISPVSYRIEDRRVQNDQSYSKKKIIIKNK
jgi:ferric-dicitrate binding protein FerR (iron transport regulator)